MAVSRIVQTGAESNGAESYLTELMYATNSSLQSSAQARTGTYSWYLGGAYVYGLLSVPSTRQLRLGFHYYAGLFNGSSSPWSNCPIITVLTAPMVHLASVCNSGNNMSGLSLFAETVLRDIDTGCVVQGQWNFIGFDVKIDSSAGWLKVYVNGVEVLSYTGDTGDADIGIVQIASPSQFAWATAGYIDDLIIDDTTGEGSAACPPDVRLEYITPNGNGNYSQLDGSDGNQTDNYLQVDDQPHNGDTDYNEAQAADEKDSYAMTTVSLDTGWSIAAVIPYAFVRKTDGGVATKMALMTRLSGTDDEGASQDLQTSYAAIFERFTLDPGGGAWSQADLDAVEIGVVGKGTF